MSVSRFLSEGLFIAPQMRRARGRMDHAKSAATCAGEWRQAFSGRKWSASR